MNLYMMLKEDYNLNQFRDRIIDYIHKSENLITEFLLDSDTKEEKNYLMSELYNELDNISIEFKNIGYEYYPELPTDVEETTFVDIISNFKDEVRNILDDFVEDNFESYITQVRYIMNLIEIHRTNY